MKRLIHSLMITSVFLSGNTRANENFQVLYSSELGQEILISIPSEKFLARGSNLKKGDPFRFDVQKFRKIAIEYAKGVKGFSGLVNSSVAMVNNPDSDSDYYFLATLIDENKNCLRIVLNGEYEIWPIGDVHDPFK